MLHFIFRICGPCFGRRSPEDEGYTLGHLGPPIAEPDQSPRALHVLEGNEPWPRNEEYVRIWRNAGGSLAEGENATRDMFYRVGPRMFCAGSGGFSAAKPSAKAHWPRPQQTKGEHIPT